MDEDVGFNVLTDDAWERMSKAIRQSEADLAGSGFNDDYSPANQGGNVVRITGPRIACTTTTTTTGTGTTSATTITSTTTTSTTATTTTTTVGIKYIYPAVFVYRNFDSLDDSRWWFSGDICYAQETNNQVLIEGQRYPGEFIGLYAGLAVIGVTVSSAPSTPDCDCDDDATQVVTKTVTFYSSTIDPVTGQCCTTKTVICFPYDVVVCTSPPTCPAVPPLPPTSVVHTSNVKRASNF